jgi:hypothetical protein
MVQEQNEIRRQIAETRREITRDLDVLASELSRQARQLADWQRPLRQHLGPVVAIGFVGGVLLGWKLGG